MKKAVVLLSGGLDSSTVLYFAKKKGYVCHCLLFDYGQRHRKELGIAQRIARNAGCRYVILKFKLPWGGSSLLDKKSKIPEEGIHAKHGGLPSTYVPGRNTIFISFALSYAETIKAYTIFIGANALDFSGYPDCRPEYFRAWNKLLKALNDKVKIEVPLQNLSKAKIIKLGLKLRVPYELTWSCYKGGAVPCGICDSCRFRAKGFKQAGIKDPATKAEMRIRN